MESRTCNQSKGDGKKWEKEEAAMDKEQQQLGTFTPGYRSSREESRSGRVTLTVGREGGHGRGGQNYDIYETAKITVTLRKPLVCLGTPDFNSKRTAI